MNVWSTKFVLLLVMLALPSSCSVVHAQYDPWSFILPEQRSIEIRRPSEISRAPIPFVPRPPTVANPDFDASPRYLALSDAINTSLANMDVVRVLAGVTAVSSGRTVYDVAITNTQIDQQRSVFDPNLRVNNAWSRSELSNIFENPLDPLTAVTGGTSDNYNFDYGLSKRTVTGGIIDFGVNSLRTERRPGLLPVNPLTSSSVDLSFTQPLLQGGGATVNRIPIVLARINTERSFFQYKDSVQSNVQGVIEAYWGLVFARTDLWAREQQVEQLQFAYDRALAQLETGIFNAGEVAQPRVALENFRAILIASKANVLQREAALRNILGLPPYEPNRVIPVSSLVDEKVEIDWEGILSLAETQRPDIIELKLVLEADQQRLVLSRNQALPRLDGVALYRWNGLEGELPSGAFVSTQPGQFADWNLGVNFSVPLGLRGERALLRQQELIIRRDQANLQQGLHQAVHVLAENLRNLEQFYQQYERYTAVREAAKINLDQQMASYNEGLIQFIVVLQAVVDWGNSVSNEAQSLVQYNNELARLERETGSILEAHGIAFYEERFGSIGPLGRLAHDQCYPYSTPPGDNTIDPYGSSNAPSEDSFNLIDPLENKQESDENSDGGPEFPASPSDVRPPFESIEAPQAQSLGRRMLEGPVRAAEALRGLFR